MTTKVGDYLVKRCYDTDTNKDFFDVYVSSEHETYGEYVGEISIEDAQANNLIDDDYNINVDEMEDYILTEF